MTRHPDLLVVGAGIVGAATAYLAARAGLAVTVVDRGVPGAGTSSHGEGNILVSDKELGPELDLALYSNEVWRTELLDAGHLWELEPKGGVVVASTAASLEALLRLAEHQRSAGIAAEPVGADGLADLEPHLAPGLAGGVLYPQDAQLMPMLAVAHLLRLARELGARVLPRTAVTGFLRDGDRVTGVRTHAGDLPAGAVLNAAGPWAGDVAALAGVHLPVAPRRGFVLVTEPLPPTVRHKVYAAEYVSDVASGDAALQSSPVVEGTPGGTVLIGSTRERVGFDATVSVPALARMAAAAVRLFPVLAGVTAMRHYHGFRPYCPDHLPVIGPDPRAPGLWHAGGHEGAGIGLSAGTGALLVQALTGRETALPLTPFAPERFG
ncbi:glycine/D-amino acid oxidase-like deaminating enzyme [Georgenia soli]|uniref:Glycine/D-amino acid oxidase-like deaminating enzyme n=1 Tax=Georgenia soli TaxID=638953 RepID=A0A2A9EKF4_9MICO|nr:FAD-dependent oxidoreductase [Georgenia soli]PFG39567.1 glycine/D-amino acid oxidase-like deaminating enzyme [Georgenia soli]